MGLEEQGREVRYRVFSHTPIHKEIIMKRDIYQEITTAILEALQAGVRPWKQCYTTNLPLRTTGDHYKGINCLRLMLEAERKGYSSPHWMTFQQATERGGRIF